MVMTFKDFQEAIMSGELPKVSNKLNVNQVKSRGPRSGNPLRSRKVNPNRNDVLSQKASGGRHRQFKGISSTQSVKQQQANKQRTQQGQLRNYGKGSLTLNKVL